jgi:hypothetical protein
MTSLGSVGIVFSGFVVATLLERSLYLCSLLYTSCDVIS